ncbi:MAG: LysM peptidoglycan-binding domain-containing protein [Chlamydiia bacterium]|nr:LysM peptidoglycan-binding domain-containing protein [Chlamydiia bacterium]
MEQVLSRRSRILIHLLIISGTLNIALIATFITFVLKDRNGVTLPTLSSTQKIKEVRLRNEDVLKEFASMPYDALVKELYNETHVEEGQRRCDLALAALVTYHHFDVERAVSGFSIEKRKVVFGNQAMTLYPGMDGERFEGIRLFARQEVWPLTPQGLFIEIKERKSIPDTLREAFSMTHEFFELKRAFGRLPYAISDQALFRLAYEGDWESISTFTEGEWAPFLVPRMMNGSQLAAYLLILLDKEFALKGLDDHQMGRLLSLLTEKTVEVEAFLKDVAGGIRSEHVHTLAEKPLEAPPRRYVVQSGDSLWKISRMFDVKVEVIQEMNALVSETLKPGTELILPAMGEDHILRDARDGI